MRKDHNNSLPMMECDQDAQQLRPRGHLRHHPRPRHRHATIPKAGSRISSTSRNIPMLTINLLQALPKTPLWDRLRARRTGSSNDPTPRKQRALPAALRRGGGDLAALPSPTPTIPSGCSRASSTRSTRPIANRIGRARRAASSPGRTCARRGAGRPRRAGTSASSRTTAARSGAPSRHALAPRPDRRACSAWASSRTT